MFLHSYPEWTKRRTVAAFEEYERLSKDRTDHVLFYALSAGSLNGPNRRAEGDDKIIFECQHVLKHLIELGVPENRLFGDFLSWDITANALSLRLLVEGLIATHRHDPEAIRSDVHHLKRPEKVVQIDIFSSDFHVDRIKTIFEWVFSLNPSLGNRVVLRMYNVPSVGLAWTEDKEEWDKRMNHENQAVQQNRVLQRKIKTISEFQAFILLGGHNGYRQYLFNSYQRSEGAGW